MTEHAELRSRRIVLAVACLAGFALLAVLVSTPWSPLPELDTDFGSWPESFTARHESVYWFWRAVSIAFATVPLTVATVVTAVALFAKSYRRAAGWTVGVMATVALATWGLKNLVGRERPVWEDPLVTLSSYSFPSGHATGTAGAAGVAIVLTHLLVRRRGVRRAVTGLAVAVTLLVGADRIFLGVHNLSDVVAGYLLSTAIVLLWLAAYDPTPRTIAQAASLAPALPDPLPAQRKKLAVILNPIKVDDVGQFEALVESMAAESGFTGGVAWWQTSVEDTGYGMAHEAAVSGCDVVVAVGGDGTVRAVCEELAGTGIPVGIVPAGTGNLLARNLAVPLYLRSAVDVALNGQDRAIDMVEVSGDKMEDATFLVMAGMGFDAAIMEGVNEDIKAKVGWLAYVLSALKSLMFPAIRVEVSVDGAPFTRHRARTLVVGNVGLLQGGMPLIPDAVIDDGQLDVVLLYPRRFLSWVPLAARVLTRSGRTDELITRMTGREVVVRANTDAPRQLDGDLIAPGREIIARCVHGRLLVRVPR
ncbi:lipid kinase, YegS/Rv2252/BmrU family [Nocardioides scoriae]|uniref:Lipid kinase, YegS/Rv2252/BmrU family n=1 Tax=Nocardioides scoriae TaxID=642780 RepID=A0A1H1UWV5_9ACTN|nr:diacylglycerol kinase family protein [Nocardioides scoriae]SDS77017.1 lipid kinase, YegS/Rv2252/BmrU family [Nocardioides scoriae]